MVPLIDLALGVLLLAVAGFIAMLAYGLYKDVTKHDKEQK